VTLPLENRWYNLDSGNKPATSALSGACRVFSLPAPSWMAGGLMGLRSELAGPWREMVSPSSLAVFKFTSSSNFVGCSTGGSAGLARLRILSTYVVARRLPRFGDVPPAWPGHSVLIGKYRLGEIPPGLEPTCQQFLVNDRLARLASADDQARRRNAPSSASSGSTVRRPGRTAV
jgi:hypothetical protein